MCAWAFALINMLQTSACSLASRRKRRWRPVDQEQSDLRILREFGCNVADSVERLRTCARDSLCHRLVEWLGRDCRKSDRFIKQASLQTRKLQRARDVQAFGQSAARACRVATGQFQPSSGPESCEHEVDESAFGAELGRVVEQCLRFVELTTFVEKLTQQGPGELRNICWASGRQQRDSDRTSQVRFGAGDVELLVRGDRRKTVSVADAQRPGGLLMVLVSPPLPAQRVVEVEHPGGPK